MQIINIQYCFNARKVFRTIYVFPFYVYKSSKLIFLFVTRKIPFNTIYLSFWIKHGIINYSQDLYFREFRWQHAMNLRDYVQTTSLAFHINYSKWNKYISKFHKILLRLHILRDPWTSSLKRPWASFTGTDMQYYFQVC